MRRLIFISLVLFSFASCDTKIENGDLVYLKLREGHNISIINNNGQLQCSDENKTPLIFSSKQEGGITLKTEKGLGVVLDNYFLFARKEEPSLFKLDTLEDNNIYLVSEFNRYFDCNGKEVYETYEPRIKIYKY